MAALPAFQPASRYRNILIPDLYTEVAQQNTTRPFARLTDADDDNAAITEVKWDQFFADARHAAFDHLKYGQFRNVGEAPVIVAILARSGYRYYINMVGAILNGWTTLLLSPRNSPAALEHLLKTSAAAYFLVDEPFLELANAMKELLPNIVIIPLSDPLDGIPANDEGLAPIRPPVSTEVAAKDLDLPVNYLHTSGSTGHPKLIPWTHRYYLSGTRVRQGEPGFSEYPVYAPLPLFHAMGIFTYGMWALGVGAVTTFVTTTRPMTGGVLLRSVRNFVDVSITAPPSLLEEIADAGPESIARLAKAKMVYYAGAGLKESAGKALVEGGVNLATAYGSTEINFGTVSTLVTEDREELKTDWPYVRWRPGYVYHMLPVEGYDDLKELIVSPGPEDSPAVINHENPRGFQTNDLWARHPTKPDLWRHAGRKDDVTVLSNGEKTNNKQIEVLLSKNLDIKYVVVFGTGRLQNGVLLHPTNPGKSPAEFVDSIWHTIEHVNSVVPTHSRLVRELVLVSKPEKPLPITDKATVKAKDSIRLYDDEINEAYLSLEVESTEVPLPSTFDEESLRNFARALVKNALGVEAADDQDLFESGLDSLTATKVRSGLLAVVRRTNSSNVPVPRNIVYTNPSINGLTSFLLARATGEAQGGKATPAEKIAASIARYGSNFATHTPDPNFIAQDGDVVAITGSTGSIGSHLLVLLLNKPGVRKVYLLNRRSKTGTGEERQKEAFASRGLDVGLLDRNASRIIYYDVDLSRPDLGLESLSLEEFRQNVTHIVHGAWQLNFNLILENFEKVHIAGTRHLIDIALSSPRETAPRLVFLSSISSVGAYNLGPSVPEVSIEDPNTPLDQGYGQSKHVSERLIALAANAGLPGTIVRIGQLSGSKETGAWNASEHVPIMFKSSVALGQIPDNLPPIRWLPTDIAAQVLLDLTYAKPNAELTSYYHIENSTETKWSNIAQIVSEVSGGRVNPVPTKVWLDEVQKASHQPDAEKNVPAIKLLGFFHDAVNAEVDFAYLDTSKTSAISPGVGYGQIGKEIMEKYLAPYL